ncbi:MAG: DUF4912 domain-containing protein [Fibrobacterota bacterium]|nr:DUF4912 domain-containing protein [Chitinispirillaceae bacterium]
MVQINEHLKAIAKPSVHHAAGKPTALSMVTHQPVQPVSGIVFEKEFFDEQINTSNPDTESSMHASDEIQTGENCSAREPESDAESILQKNTSTGPRYSFSTEIPETYDDFYLCVLPRDPKMLYVYWELPDGTRSKEHNFQEQAPSKEQLVLRVKGQTIDNFEPHISSCYDVPILMNAADSYVHVPTGASQCSVECGIINEYGHFRPYTPHCHSDDQSSETAHFHTGEGIENRQPSDEYRVESAPVSVGASFAGPASDAYCPADTNNITVPLVRSIDLPGVKLDTTHYFGSATPV